MRLKLYQILVYIELTSVSYTHLDVYKRQDNKVIQNGLNLLYKNYVI